MHLQHTHYTNCYSEGSLHHIDHISEEICPCWLITGILFQIVLLHWKSVEQLEGGGYSSLLTMNQQLPRSLVIQNKDGSATDSLLPLLELISACDIPIIGMTI